MLKMIEDLNPYIKKFGTDLSRFDPVLMEELKTFSTNGETVALPFKMNIPAFFYNKDLFDKFGVSYPANGMTWDEVFEKAKQLTRVDGSTQYLGVYTGGADRMAMGANLPYVDPKTNRGILQTDDWKQVLTLFASAMSLPGYVANGKLPDLYKIFMSEKRVAMAAFWGPDAIGSLYDLDKNGQGMNWGMVTVPTLKKGQGYAWQVDAHTLVVSSASKHKEQAYQVLALMTSDEIQNLLNKNGILTGLKKTPELIKQYGSEVPSMKGKDVSALFALKPAVKVFTKYDDKARGLINNAANDVLIKNIDVNTALRNAEEQLNKYIDEVNAQ
jgi:multiple sugar transport system substrate-binding protein